MAGISPRNVKIITITTLLVMLLCQPSLAQQEYGSLCISPAPGDDVPKTTGVDSLCFDFKFGLKIDQQKAFSWSTKESVKIDRLDLGARHLVVVYCDGKPHQSFYFRFSEFKNRNLCLFLNDFYKTVQLWDPKESPTPWCKCKSSE